MFLGVTDMSKHPSHATRKLALACLLALPHFPATLPAPAQVYRWDNGQLCPGTQNIPPVPGAIYSNFSRADRNLDFADLQSKQLTSTQITASSLTSAKLTGANLTSADFRLSFLTNADLTSANLTSALLLDTTFTSATLTGATITGAILFGARDLTAEQFYSTGSYQLKNLTAVSFGTNDLTGWNFASQNLFSAFFSGGNLTSVDFTSANLTATNLGTATLTSATFTGAHITRANLSETTPQNFTPAQLYSTASYQGKDLSGVDLSFNNLTSWNFSSQYLTSASFLGSSLTSTNFTLADLRSAKFFLPAASTLTRNTILPNGTLPGLHLLPTDTLTIRDHLLPVTVTTTFLIDPAATLEFRLLDADFTSPLSTSLTPTLNGTLAITLAPSLNPASLLDIPIDLFNFTGQLPSTTFATISTNLDPTLYRWETTHLYTTGTITARFIPEPTLLAPLALAATPLLRRRK
jgi:uncharacterized protein YjbI with pentapeptide repeats